VIIGLVASTEHDILHSLSVLEFLLLKQEEGVNPQYEAKDLLSSELSNKQHERRLLCLEMFSAWWKIFTGDSSAITLPTDKITAVQNYINALQEQIDAILTALLSGSIQKGQAQRFCTLKDLAMLISGIASPWLTDFLNKLLARLDTQVIPRKTADYPPGKGWSTCRLGFREGARTWRVGSRLGPSTTKSVSDLRRIKERIPICPDRHPP